MLKIKQFTSQVHPHAPGIRPSSVMAEFGGIFTGSILPAGQNPLILKFRWSFSVGDYYR